MSVSSTSTVTVVLRQNSIPNEVFTEEGLEDKAIAKSSTSTPLDDKLISTVESQDSEEVVKEEPELRIVKIVKGFFHSLASLFKSVDRSTAPSQASAGDASQEEVDGSEKEPELDERKGSEEPLQTFGRAIKQEPESPDYERHVSSSEGALTEDSTVSVDPAEEKEPLSDVQEYIFKGLKKELKDFFTQNRNKQHINKILNDAEAHYCAVLNSNLRRYKDLDAEDKIALALQKSRDFLALRYQKIKK